MRPWLGKIMPPKAVEETLGGVMYPTTGLRNLQQYLGVSGEIEKAKGILPEQKKGLADIAETLFGITEKRKRPGVTGFKYGEGLRRGAEVIREPTKPEPKPRTGILGEFDEWKIIPGNEAKTFADFYGWRANITKEKAGTMTLLEVSGELRKWMGLRKSIDDPTMLETMVRAFRKDVALGPPTNEDKEELKRMIDDEIDYWRSELAAKKLKPGGRSDVLNLRREIDAILRESE